MPKGYPKKKEAIAATAPDNALNTQELLDEIAQLKREKAELVKTQVDAEPDDAMAYLKAIAGAVAGGQGKPLPHGTPVRAKTLPEGYGKPWVLTDERREEVAAIFDKYAGKGLEYKIDGNSGSVTFRKKIKIRVYDKETETWTREEAWKSESVHLSSSDATINKLIKFMLLV